MGKCTEMLSKNFTDMLIQAESNRKRPYITADFDSTVTVQGPPTTLASVRKLISEFLNSTQSNRVGRHIPIFAPYHASHLYSECDFAKLVEGLASFDETPGFNKELGFSSALLSPYSGCLVGGKSPPDILHDILQDLLARPIKWSDLIRGTASYLTSVELTKYDVRCFGPVHSHKLFASTMQNLLQSEVKLCDTTVQSNGESSRRATNIPIAVIGMSGRFPNANSVDELWSILADGVDCHKVVIYIPCDLVNDIIGANG
jgi:iron transport multicopper oxidase